MIPRLKAALGADNSENQRKVMHVKSSLKNCLKDKTVRYDFFKEERAVVLKTITFTNPMGNLSHMK